MTGVVTGTVTATHRITRDDLRRYADASGDHNPIHLDPGAARAVGLPGVIAHGMLVMGLALRTVEDRAGGPATVTDCAARWTRPVVVGEDGAEQRVEVTVVERLAGGRLRLRVTARCGPDRVDGARPGGPREHRPPPRPGLRLPRAALPAPPGGPLPRGRRQRRRRVGRDRSAGG